MYLHQKFDLPQLIQCGFLNVIKQRKLVNQENINKKYYQNRTALHIAIISNQPQIAQYLSTFDCDLSLKDSLNMTIIDWIDLKPNKEIFKQFLLQNQQKITMHVEKKEQMLMNNQENNKKMNILRAAQIGIQKVKQIITQGNPFIKDQFGRKAIHWAAIAGNVEVFEFLVEKKFDPRLEDNFGFNCYNYACQNPCNPLNKLFKNQVQQQVNLEYLVKQDTYDVIIIGAGASGIGAGVTLTKSGISFLILEARDRIGGRIVSTKVDDYEVDLGAAWVHSYGKNNPICKEMNKLNWKPKKTLEHTDTIMKSQIVQNLKDKDIEQCFMIYQLYLFMIQNKAKMSENDLSFEQAGKQFYEQKIMTLEHHKKSFVDMLINMNQHYNASSVSQLSAKYYDQQIDTGGDFTPQGSYSSLINAIAKKSDLQKRIKFQKQVIRINYFHEYVQIQCKDGSTYHAKKVVSSLPLGILKSQTVKFIPDLPEQHQQVIKRLGYGTMNKIIISFQEPFWKKNPAWIRIACFQKGKFPFFFNLSTENKHILCCFVTDNFAEKISKLTDGEIIKEVIQLLKKTFKKQEIKVKDYKITRWNEDPYSLGSFSHFGVGSNIESTKKLRKNIDRKLWFVGEHCYGEHIGCAHGAFQTGIWAAEQILDVIKQFKF